MKLYRAAMIATCLAAMTLGGTAYATPITGDPGADGWALFGNSLSQGVYVKGDDNYGYDAYSAGFTIESGSNLDISDGSLSWLTGDTVLGVGGQFHSIDAATAGWPSFSGGAVNSHLSASNGPKLQAKFGTADATWSTSTEAPDAGNGNSSSSAGGGRVQVRTSAWFASTNWQAGSGDLLLLDKDDHILWDGDSNLDKRVARVIWNWDDALGQVDSWELLLNVSLLDRIAPDGYAGLLPSIGDQTILTVQNKDGAYTDALVTINAVDDPVAVPGPGTLLLFAASLLGLTMVTRRRQRG